MAGFCVRIAGLSIRVVPDDPALRLSPDPSLLAFRHDSAAADVTVNVRWTDIAGHPGGVPLFDSGGVWRLFGEPGRLTFSFATGSRARPYKTASFDCGFHQGLILLNRLELDALSPVDPLEYPLDELLVVHMLSRGRGVEVHAAGVVDSDGRGFLCVGESGAGKSTLARIWLEFPGIEILSDDRVILRRDGDHIAMHGTPWHGEGRLVSNRGVQYLRNP